MNDKKMEHEDYQRQGKNNKRKGADYERFICKTINDYLGTSFTRTPMSGGMQWKGDIINSNGCNSIMDSIHFEIKNCQNLHLVTWLKQAYQDSPGRKAPSVISKVPKVFETIDNSRSKVQHIITMDLMDFLNLMKIIDEKEVDNADEQQVPETSKDFGQTKYDLQKGAKLLREMQDRYNKEDRERKEKYGNNNKKYRERVKKFKRDRAKDFRETIRKDRG